MTQNKERKERWGILRSSEKNVVKFTFFFISIFVREMEMHRDTYFCIGLRIFLYFHKGIRYWFKILLTFVHLGPNKAKNFITNHIFSSKSSIGHCRLSSKKGNEALKKKQILIRFRDLCIWFLLKFIKNLSWPTWDSQE